MSDLINRIDELERKANREEPRIIIHYEHEAPDPTPTPNDLVIVVAYREESKAAN